MVVGPEERRTAFVSRRLLGVYRGESISTVWVRRDKVLVTSVKTGVDDLSESR